MGADGSYSGNPASSDRDQVRFLTGDTNEDSLILSDAEIDAALTWFPAPGQAAVYCAEAIAAKFASKVSKSVGDLSIQYSDLAKAFRDLAKSLAIRFATTAATAPVYAGGISISDKAAVESNTDRVAPRFKRDQFMNDGSASDD